MCRSKNSYLVTGPRPEPDVSQRHLFEGHLRSTSRSAATSRQHRQADASDPPVCDGETKREECTAPSRTPHTPRGRVRYSVEIAARTLSLAARRAGPMAATTPATAEPLSDSSHYRSPRKVGNRWTSCAHRQRGRAVEACAVGHRRLVQAATWATSASPRTPLSASAKVTITIQMICIDQPPFAKRGCMANP